MIHFTVGPSQLYPTYQSHHDEALKKDIGSISHRSPAFHALYQHTQEQLRTLLNVPPTHAILFASSATEIWERILFNLVEAFSFHFINGEFSQKFFLFAQALQKKTAAHTVPAGEGLNVLDVDIPALTELICTTQNETSTGAQIPAADLARLKQKYPQMLLCTDIVSSAPYVNLDYAAMDMAFFSVQKAFGMPAGLGVWIVRKDCLEKHTKMVESECMVGAHHTLASYLAFDQKSETPSTPNVMAIYLLGKIAEDLNRKTVKVLRTELEEKAGLLYKFANEGGAFSPFVKSASHRSQTSIVLQTKKPASAVISALKEKGYLVGSGYGPYKDQHIRVANFPATTPAQMTDLIAELRKL